MVNADDFFPALEEWADRRDVVDPSLREELRRILAAWLNEKRHEFFSTENPADDEGDACAILRWKSGAHCLRWMFVSEKRTGSVRGFQIKDDSPQIANSSPLQVAHDAMARDFGETHFSNRERHNHYIQDYTQKNLGHKMSEMADQNAEDILDLLADAIGEELSRRQMLKSFGEDQDTQLCALIKRHEEKEIRRVFHDFIRVLDQDALKIMRRDRNRIGFLYEWLIGHQDKESTTWSNASSPPAASMEAQRNRQKAARSFPCLMWFMAQDFRLTEAIDRGDPLVPALIKSMNKDPFRRDWPVTAEAISILRGKRTQDIDPKFKGTADTNGGFYHFHQVLGFINELPASWRPNKPCHWPPYSTFKSRVSDWSRLTGRTVQKTVGDICRAAQNIPQLKLAQRGAMTMPDYLATIGAWDRCDPYSVDNRNLKDFFDLVSHQVCLPFVFQRAAELGHVWNPKISDNDQYNPLQPKYQAEWLRLIFKGISVEKILRANEKWHSNAARVQQRTSRLPEESEREWPALIAPLTTPDGVTVRCLTSTTELKAEGQEQAHCVGGYINQYISKGTFKRRT